MVAQPGQTQGSGSVPDEEMGYIASDRYAKTISRVQSRVQSRAVSPDMERGEGSVQSQERDEEGNVIHIDEPTHGAGILRHGTADVDAKSPSLGEEEEGEREGEREEASILALDEVLKRQKGQFMQAAVTPRGASARSRPRSSLAYEEEEEGEEGEKERKILVKTDSRNSVRTPYEELSPVDEKRKPLFEEEDEEEDEDEEDKSPLPKELEKLRPRLNENRFPSNDTWEDAPDSAHLSATLESPVPEQSSLAEGEDQDEHNPESKAHQRRNSNEPEPEYVQGQPGDHYQPGHTSSLATIHPGRQPCNIYNGGGIQTMEGIYNKSLHTC